MLPSFWRSTPEELEIQARDPKPPYGDKLPAHLIPKEEPREPSEGDNKLKAKKSEADDESRAKQHNKPENKNDDKPPSPPRSDNDTDKPQMPQSDKHVTPRQTESTSLAENSSTADKVAGKIFPELAVDTPPVPAPAPNVIPAQTAARNAPPSSDKEARTAEPTQRVNEPDMDTKRARQNLADASEASESRASVNQAAEEQGRQAAQLMADFTSSIPAQPRAALSAPSIKAVLVGKSDPVYFSSAVRAFEAVDQDDDGYDAVAAALEEEFDEDDLVAYAPDEEYESDEEDEADRDAAHWEHVVRGAKGK